MLVGANCPTPEKKGRFLTEELAFAALGQIRERKRRTGGYAPTRAYRCRCGLWHLTSKSGGWIEAAAEEEAVAITIRKKMGDAEVEITGAESLKALFKGLAMVGDILADADCGKCGSSAIKHEVRTVTKDGGTFEYYGLRCTACSAQLNFGQNKDGKGLFAKREENPETRGWYIYQRDGGNSGGGHRDEQDQRGPEDDIPF